MRRPSTLLPAAALAGTIAASLVLGPAPAVAQDTREALEQQLKEQQARNQALKERIAKLEAVLNTDVCTNPEAEAILRQQTPPTPPR